MYPIDSKFKVIGGELPPFSQEQIKNEPMFFSARPDFAYENGGPITKAFMKKVCDWEGFGALNLNSEFCFDSRVHMLMPGWWPCIPGWHHDDVPRTRPDGQPNYESPEYTSQHILALINGDIAPTEFATGLVSYPHIKEDTVYKIWNDLVNQDIADGSLAVHKMPSNRLIRFDNQSWHRGTKAVGKGWRWFGRLTWDAGYETGRPRYNEIRRQVNVYLDFPEAGW